MPDQRRSAKVEIRKSNHSRFTLAFTVLSLLALAPIGSARPQGQTAPLLATADAVLAEMSRITGLAIRAPLKKQMVTRAEVRKYLVENLHAEFTPEDLYAQQATLEAFGLVSRDFDLEKFLIAFYTEQTAGFYDPRRKTMFIADWPEEDMQRLVLAHELTHALQDQNFDLDRFLHAARANDDATSARQAVVEGYATAAMMQRLIEPVELAGLPSLEPLMTRMVHQQMAQFPAFTEAPYFFRLQALFPYAQGMGFIERGLAQGGWEKLNEVFANPPVTTREIFRPADYFERRPRPEVSLPRPTALSGASQVRLLAENTLGELGYYSLLGQMVSEDEAKATAAAWAGDRFILYEGPAKNRFLLVARSRWSNEESALAFFRDYRRILAGKYPELSAGKGSAADLFMGSAETGQIVVLRKGREVLWAEGVPEGLGEAIRSFLRSLPPS